MPRVLAIETSCDETSVALLCGSAEKPTLEAHITLSHAHKTQKYGGIVPEIVAREHLQYLEPTIRQALAKSQNNFQNNFDYIDLIAATCGPGLLGGLIVGSTTAKTLALANNIPFLAINHLEGHALSPRLSALTEPCLAESCLAETPPAPVPPAAPAAVPPAAPAAAPPAAPAFPYLLLLVSGGHCQLLLVQALGDYRLLGQTRDDSAGECLDKGARLLQLPEASGAAIEKAARNGNPQRFAQEITPLPQPMLKAENCDFSFSGLKSALARALARAEASRTLSAQQRLDGAAALQKAVFGQLAERCEKALETLGAQKINLAAFAVAGGVAANRTLYDQLRRIAEKHSLPFFCPRIELCTDNAAMIAYAALAHSESKNKSKSKTKSKTKTQKEKNDTSSPSSPSSLSFPVRPRWSLQAAGCVEKKTYLHSFLRSFLHSCPNARKAHEKPRQKTYSTQAKGLPTALQTKEQS